jgi:hypothetical protein
MRRVQPAQDATGASRVHPQAGRRLPRNRRPQELLRLPGTADRVPATARRARAASPLFGVQTRALLRSPTLGDRPVEVPRLFCTSFRNSLADESSSRCRPAPARSASPWAVPITGRIERRSARSTVLCRGPRIAGDIRHVRPPMNGKPIRLLPVRFRSLPACARLQKFQCESHREVASKTLRPVERHAGGVRRPRQGAC